MEGTGDGGGGWRVGAGDEGICETSDLRIACDPSTVGANTIKLFTAVI